MGFLFGSAKNILGLIVLLLVFGAGFWAGHQTGLVRSAVNVETAAAALAGGPLCGEIRTEGNFKVMVVPRPWGYQFYGSAPQQRDGYYAVHLVPAPVTDQIRQGAQDTWAALRGLMNRLFGGK